MPRNRVHLRIDNQPDGPNIAAPVGTPVESFAPPAAGYVPPPTNLTLTTGIAQSDRSATAYIDADWNRPPSEVQSYEVRFSQSSTFASDIGTLSAGQDSARIPSVKPGVAYTVQVRALYREERSAWSAAASITTAIDDAPPGPVAGSTGTWSVGGDLRVVFTPPTSANYWRTRVVIRKDNAAGALVLTDHTATSSFIFSAEQNRQLAGLYPVLWIELTTQNQSGYYQLATNAVSLTATKVRPDSVTGVAHSWTGDTGSASPDLNISWAAASGANRYQLSIDGVIVYVGPLTSYVYALAENRTRHSGTPDHDLTYSIVALDGLDQTSATTATGTATNAAPAAPAISLAFGWQMLLARITSTLPVDFQAAEYAWERSLDSGSTWTSVRTQQSTSQSQELENTLDGVIQYRVRVRVQDVFLRWSSQTTSSAVVIDGFSMTAYRARTTYTDSNGNTDAALAVLRDGIDLTGGITYASWTSGWRWTQAERTFVDRYATVTMAATTSLGYLGLSKGDGVWTWYSGPFAADGRTLTLVASEAAAQSAAVALPVDSTLELPAPIEARIIRLGHRNTTITYTIREFYPRTLIETDDIRSDTVRTRHIGVGQVTADRISVAFLSAIIADMGSLTAGQIVIGSSNKLWLNDANDGGLAIGGITKGSAPFRVSAVGALVATNATISGNITATSGSFTGSISGSVITGGTVTGATVQTAASGQRVALDSNGLTGYNSSNVVQSRIRASDGAFEALGGALVINQSGFNISSGSDFGTSTLTVRRTIDANTQRLISMYATSEGGFIVGGEGGIYPQAGRIWFHSNGSVRFGQTAVATTLDVIVNLGNLTVPGDITANGMLGEGPSLRLVGTTHTFMEFYPQGRVSGRKAYFGFGSSGSVDVALVNQNSTGAILLSAAGGTSISNNTGIGTNVPTTSRLATRGATSDSTQNSFIAQNSNVANLMYLRNDGYSWVNQNWAVGSDEALKDAVEGIGAALPMLRRLMPKRYRLKHDRRKEHTGFIAQDFKKVLPEMVEEDEEGLLSIRYGDLIPYHTAALGELATTDEELREEIRNIKNDILVLKNRKLA